MNAKIAAHFRLTGFDSSPDEITALIGLQPTRAWRAGDPFDPRTTIRHRHNTWILDAGLEDTRSLEDHVKAVLDQLQGSRSVVATLCSMYSGTIDCVIRCYDREAPAIHFDRDTIRRAGELQAEIDVDLYILDDGTS